MVIATLQILVLLVLAAIIRGAIIDGYSAWSLELAFVLMLSPFLLLLFARNNNSRSDQVNQDAGQDLDRQN